MVAIDPHSQRLLSYVQHGLASRQSSHGVKIDADLFGERDAIQMRTDLLDTHICICAPEVLVLFSDNFDFQVGLCRCLADPLQKLHLPLLLLL